MNIDLAKINNVGRSPKSKTDPASENSADSVVDEAEELARAEREQWGLRQVWTTRLLKAGILAALGAGIVALILVVFGSSPTPNLTDNATEDTADVDTVGQAKAEDLARQFVVAWLQASRGNEQELDHFVSGNPSLPTAPLFAATDPAVASIDYEQKSRTYAVTVSVTVRAATDANAATVRRYFQVPVVVTEAGVRAAALPAEVAEPSTSIDVKLGYKYRVANHPIATSAHEFLSAMLTGNGEVARYLTPGISIAPIVPAPYRSVAITDVYSSEDLSAASASAPLPDGDVVRLLVTAAQKVTEVDSVSGQYALTMTSRGGRWEVSAIDATPLYPPAAPRTPSSSTTTPSSTTPSAGAPESASSDSGQLPASSDSGQTPALSVPTAGDVPLFSLSGTDPHSSGR
ncbi:MAG: hypothetical protein EOP32_40400 [Rhodococcus sp. (in: high G+C Gram-positive bacteria)]|nr:MAG: hypothetical protein EOP32_40400 [Rhodococcus sp. (in: high G+C Gram-positive bacteria)]